MRVVLYGGPEHALELARLAARTTPVGEEKWSVVAVPPWSEDAIWYYARHEAECNAIAESDMAMGSVLAATCGFGLEVQELCRRISSGADIDVACSEQAQKLGTSLEAVYARIGMPGGFSKEDRQAAEMFLVGVGEGLPRHVQGDPATPSEELENAMAAAGIDKGMLDFLSWMGVIQEDNRGRWIVPPHIGRLAGEG